MGMIAPSAPMALLQTDTKALKRRNRNKKNKQMIQTEETQQAILNGAAHTFNNKTKLSIPF